MSGAAVYVVDRFGGWHAKVLSCLAALCDPASGAFPADAMSQVLATLSADPEMASMNPKTLKQTGGAPGWLSVGCVWGCKDYEAGLYPVSLISHTP